MKNPNIFYFKLSRKIWKSFEEVKLMTNSKFKNLVKDRLKQNAFEYLMNKQESKVKPNSYTELSMAEYLLPTNAILSIYKKREMFAVKNRIKIFPLTFPNQLKNINVNAEIKNIWLKYIIVIC